jgi:hypothetical protein
MPFVYLNIKKPWVAWMAYRGELVSARYLDPSAISYWHASYLFNSNWLNYQKEAKIETIRRRLHGDGNGVGRLSGLFIFDTIDDANRAGNCWDRDSFSPEYLVEIGIKNEMCRSVFDSNWITNCMSLTDDEWMEDYVSGINFNSNPLKEVLLDGKCLIYGTELRQKAYEIVKEKWPKSLPLLELSRIAVELDSDLGAISPILISNDGEVSCNFYLNFKDATNNEFLEKLKQYNGPKNHADMQLINQFGIVVPDLREYNFSFRPTPG